MVKLAREAVGLQRQRAARRAHAHLAPRARSQRAGWGGGSASPGARRGGGAGGASSISDCSAARRRSYAMRCPCRPRGGQRAAERSARGRGGHEGVGRRLFPVETFLEFLHLKAGGGGG
jgi:hypothetical protein